MRALVRWPYSGSGSARTRSPSPRPPFSRSSFSRAIFAGPITRLIAHPPNAQYPEKLDQVFGTPSGPSWDFLFGVDTVGSDIFSRVLYGARVSLTVAIVGTGIAMLIGTTLGIIAGYYRGIVDTIISRTVDVFLAFPILLLALGVASACSLGNGCAGGLIQPGMTTVIGIIILISWTYFARLARGQVLSLREKEFVEAARATGASDLTILGREILPNLVTPMLVYHDARDPAEHPARGRALVPRRRHQPTTGELGTDDRRGHAVLRLGVVVLPLPRPRSRPHGARVQPARRGGSRRPRPPPVPDEVKGEEMGRFYRLAIVALAAIAGSALLVASTGSGATGAKRGGTLKLISAGDVDSVDPGQTYYSYGWQVLTAVHRTLYATPANSVKTVPDLAAADAEDLGGRQDGDGPHQEGRPLRPAGEPGGDLGRREVRDRAQLLGQRHERLREPLLLGPRRRAREAAEDTEARLRHQDAEQVHDRLQAQSGPGRPSQARSS